MARLYADEQYPYPVIEFLRTRIHTAITAQESLQGKLIRVVRPVQ